MVGIIVITHGNFSEEIIKSCELIAGPADRTVALTLNRNDNVDDLNERFLKSLKDVDDGDGVLVLVDLLGGSPSNVVSMNLKRGYKYQAVTGLNLSMLLEVIINRDGKSAYELAEICVGSGVDAINHINKIIV